MTEDTRENGMPPPRGGDLVRRHRPSTRLWHWINAFTIFVMLMSGLMIFNAHPRLYWGQYGANYDRAWLQIGASGGRGVLIIGRETIDTTGLLGVWKDQDGVERRRAFPWWATIPSSYSLADARIWHFFFAWVLAVSAAAYLVVSLVNRHLQRDLLPRGEELRPRHVWHDIRDHLRLRFPRGAAALRYNILQKLAYLSVILGLIPLLILTGLTMAPGVNAAWPWLLDLFGGRQSARSIHFLCAAAMLLFIVVHLLMVLLAGPFNEIRSMITGRYRLPKEVDE
ncbi:MULTISPECIES: cytochrome b/b6 domain-containing protein [unclassified Sphingomonas]|uniref:cytochrome b/b6 domain-containing protein n=1 Tax=unclassified Sphingomonas TaxID=196159 RepID=UPI0006F41E28|nr:MULTISPECIES: cytochrome b/b6 domain-containing protein [unclassified Sphingomonas]KQX18450.1 HupC [Sphingomonas sp. Root1294]KQY72224.1 HupC [Sphingomonas sp. Root50]KRB94504.1 HupC [Sphingomonas sp. Root720]